MNHTLKVFCLCLFRYSGIRKQAISRPRVSDSLGRSWGNFCIMPLMLDVWRGPACGEETTRRIQAALCKVDRPVFQGI